MRSNSIPRPSKPRGRSPLHADDDFKTSNDDETVGIGPNKKWQACKKINAHNTYILKVLLSPDCNYLATASADTTIKLFDVDDEFKHYKTLSGHQRWVWDIAFSADSAYLVSASSDKTAKLWDINKGVDILDYKRHTKALQLELVTQSLRPPKSRPRAAQLSLS